ncbi:MAG: hypothetical protein Q4G58_14660 [bacterium]|nr:hypothetical protein [bacterium]
MSAETQILLSTNIVEVPQTQGVGKNIEQIFVTLKVTGMIDPEETRKFIIEVQLYINGNTYVISRLLSNTSINDEGYISFGTVFVLGPVREDEITTKINLTYVVTE